MALDFTALGITSPQNGWHCEETSGTTLADSYGNADATVFDDGEGPTLNLDTDLGLPNIGSGVDGPGAARTPAIPALANPTALTTMAVVQIRSLPDNLNVILNYGPAGGSTTAGTFFTAVKVLDGPDGVAAAVTPEGSFDTNLEVRDPDTPLDEPLVYFMRWTAGDAMELYRARMDGEALDFGLIGTASNAITLSGNGDESINLFGAEADSERWVDGKGDEVHIWTEALSVQDMETISNAVFSENGVDGELSFTGSNAVIFADDSEPAEGATVYAVRPGEVEAASTGTTDANGEVTLTGLDAGTYATWAERDDGTGNIQTTQVIKREVT